MEANLVVCACLCVGVCLCLQFVPVRPLQERLFLDAIELP